MIGYKDGEVVEVRYPLPGQTFDVLDDLPWLTAEVISSHDDEWHVLVTHDRVVVDRRPRPETWCDASEIRNKA